MTDENSQAGMSMDDRPPKTPNDEKPPKDLLRGQLEEPQGDDRFVLSPEDRPQRRWLSSSPAYEPEQFDLNSLPDEQAGAESSAHARVQAAPPPEDHGVQDTNLPLGFVSEPRPVRKSADTAAPATPAEKPKLGFLSHEEVLASQQRGREPVDETPPPPLGYVSEPRPVTPAQPEPPAPVAVEVPEAPIEDIPAPAPELPEPAEAMPEIPEPEPTLQADAVTAPLSPPEPVAAAPTAAPEVTPAPAALEMPSPSSPPVEPASEAMDIDTAGLTPGQILRSARSNRGLSIDAIVQMTRMTPETVLALEADLPPPGQSAWVYVRGFYSRYAKALGMPEAALLAAHERIAGKPQAEAATIAPEWTPEDVSPEPKSHKSLFVVVGGVIMGVAAWWLLPMISAYTSELQPRETARAVLSTVKQSALTLGDKGEDLYKRALEKVKASRPQPKPAAPATASATVAAESAPAATVTAEPEPQAIETAPPIPEADMAEAQAAPPAEPEARTDDGPTAAPATPEPEAAAEPAPQQAAPVLSLSFTRQSWVSVADADEQLLFEGMAQEGEQRLFEGKLPLILFLGTARAVEVSFAGQQVDLSTHLRPNGTARVVLGE